MSLKLDVYYVNLDFSLMMMDFVRNVHQVAIHLMLVLLLVNLVDMVKKQIQQGLVVNSVLQEHFLLMKVNVNHVHLELFPLVLEQQNVFHVYVEQNQMVIELNVNHVSLELTRHLELNVFYVLQEQSALDQLNVLVQNVAQELRQKIQKMKIVDQQLVYFVNLVTIHLTMDSVNHVHLELFQLVLELLNAFLAHVEHNLIQMELFVYFVILVNTLSLVFFVYHVPLD